MNWKEENKNDDVCGDGKARKREAGVGTQERLLD